MHIDNTLIIITANDIAGPGVTSGKLLVSKLNHLKDTYLTEH